MMRKSNRISEKTSQVNQEEFQSPKDRVDTSRGRTHGRLKETQSTRGLKWKSFIIKYVNFIMFFMVFLPITVVIPLLAVFGSSIEADGSNMTL